MGRLVDNFRSGLFCVVVPLEDIARSCFLRLFADSILQPQYCPLDPSHYQFILSAKKAQKGPFHESASLRFRLPDHLPRDRLKLGIRPCVVHGPGISKTDTAYIARKDLLQKDWWAKLLDIQVGERRFTFVEALPVDLNVTNTFFAMHLVYVSPKGQL